MRRLWEVNVDGTYLFACEVARHLMARKAPGSIVFIGSMSGVVVNVPQPQTYVPSCCPPFQHLRGLGESRPPLTPYPTVNFRAARRDYRHGGWPFHATRLTLLPTARTMLQRLPSDTWPPPWR
jgi:NAD(P)-dependent dehydrogenase (short-subunit alcohol dehydrogenase family)